MRFFRRRRGLVRVGALLGFIHVTVLFQIGCGNVGFSSDHLDPAKDSIPHQQDSKVSVKTPTEPQIQLTGRELFRYQAHIEWPEDKKSVAIFIDDQFAFQTESSKEVHSFDVGLDHHRNYKITLTTNKNNLDKGDIFAEWTLQTPLDLLLSTETLQPLIINNQTPIEIQAHRVFIKEGNNNKSSLVTFGRPILISTNELISEKGVISTFESDSRASEGEAGRDGGWIFIKAKKARGEITFNLRGENGSDGKDGAPFTERAGSGANGTDGHSEVWDSDRRGGWTCDRPPENGKPGAPGNNGRPGMNGRSGGDTGVLKLEISEPSTEFKFKIEKENGKAGTPGKGGPGQLGGPGGQPGKSSPKCNEASSGPEGKSGDKGPDGIREKDGEFLQDCISIGEGFGRCS